MTNDKFTPDSIEAAREALRTTEDHVIQTYSSDKGLEAYLTPELNGAIDTALAALDLAERMRWLDPAVEMPEEGQAVAVAFKTENMVAYTAGRWYDTTMIPWLAWMPLPEWEVSS